VHARSLPVSKTIESVEKTLIGAHVAIIDPMLMLGLPPAITAATGMDALSHGIECYACDYRQPFNDAMALADIELVACWLRSAYHEGDNLQARTNMAHAAMFGGVSYARRARARPML
jgi:choline dehydrogenase